MRETSFRMGPFPCPNCGHELLVDTIHKNIAEEQIFDRGGLPPNYVVDHIFDNSEMDYDLFGGRFKGLGRHQLCREIIDLRVKVEELRKALKRYTEPKRSLWQRIASR